MALAPEDVGAAIARARKAKGWTHEEFARAMSANLRTVQRWQKGRDPKTGKSWLPRLATLMRVADVLEVPRSALIEIEEPLETDSVRLQRMEGQLAELRGMVAQLLQDPPPPPVRRAAPRRSA